MFFSARKLCEGYLFAQPMRAFCSYRLSARAINNVRFVGSLIAGSFKYGDIYPKLRLFILVS